jgi:Type I restriction enzyme R protein N terminus (HSDR_N)
MSVDLDKKVLDQILRYNITLQVPYLIITNGGYCMAFECINNQLEELTELPD